MTLTYLFYTNLVEIYEIIFDYRDPNIFYFLCTYLLGLFIGTMADIVNQNLGLF